MAADVVSVGEKIDLTCIVIKASELTSPCETKKTSAQSIAHNVAIMRHVPEWAAVEAVADVAHGRHIYTHKSFGVRRVFAKYPVEFFTRSRS